MKNYILIILSIIMTTHSIPAQTTNCMLVRISEIEVYQQYLDEYLKYAYTVGATSVKEEPGVICIYPMQIKRDSNQIRILEIYTSTKAYKQHIKSTHFQKYKTGTLHMIKSLDLVDMTSIDTATMSRIFIKMPKIKNKLITEKMDRIELCKTNFTHLFGGTALNNQGSDPEMMNILQTYIFGDIFQTGNLDIKTRELITCVVLTTMQQLPQLKAHATAALNIGITPIELREAIYQCAPNIGFPKTLNALSTINTVFETIGIALPLESQSTVTEENRYQKGSDIQKSLYDTDIKNTLDALPNNMGEDVARYLTEVCFGDFQTRGGLDLKTRQLLSYCIITTIATDTQLRYCLEGNLKIGNSIENIAAAVIQCMPYIGFPTALKSLEIINSYTTEHK